MRVDIIITRCNFNDINITMIMIHIFLSTRSIQKVLFIHVSRARIRRRVSHAPG